MPLLALGVLAYAAGLVLGLSGFLIAPLAVAFATAWLAVHTQRITPAALTLLTAGGAAVGTAAARHDRYCEQQALNMQTVRVVFDTPAETGVGSSAQVAGCALRVTMQVASGSARVGDVVDVRGDIRRTQRGLLVQGAHLGEVTGRDETRRWRAAAGARIDALFGSDAPLARALLVADQRQIPAEMRARYSAAGLTHMLSISGLHVGLIAIAVALVLELVRLQRRTAEAWTVVVVGVYVILLGGPAPAVRSAAMLGMLVYARRMQRPTSPWAVLAVGAAIPLRDAHAVLDVGYQLSVGGVAGLIAAGALLRRWPWLQKRRRALRMVLSAMVISTVATVVTAPLVAWNFGQVSLMGPLSNMVADPIMGVAQPMLFLALVLSPVPTIASWFAAAAHPVLRAFDLVAAWAAAVPGASLAVTPTTLTAVLGVCFAAALIAACVSRFPMRALLLAVALLAAMAWRPAVAPAPGYAEFHMIALGRGHAFALRSARGRWVLIDAGRRWLLGDDGRSSIVPYVSHRGGAVAAFMLTDDRAQDVGGAASVVTRLHPAEVLDATAGQRSSAYAEMLRAARSTGAQWGRVGDGDSLVVDEIVLRIRRVEGKAGGGAIAVLARMGGAQVLLAPDFSLTNARAVLDSGVVPDVEVLRGTVRVGNQLLDGDGGANLLVRVEADSLTIQLRDDHWRLPLRACSDRSAPRASFVCHSHIP